MELNDMQLDGLREIANIGSGTAARRGPFALAATCCWMWTGRAASLDSGS